MQPENRDETRRMLLLVDPQNDFLTGSLPVPGAPKAMDELAGWLTENPDRYILKVVTQDWHNPAHCSFASQGGQWPEHCVAGSRGAEIWPALEKALLNSSGETVYIKKAQEREEYSVFQNEKGNFLIRDLVREKSIDSIDICGVAGDICVLATLNHAGDVLGWKHINVLERFSPSLDGGEALKSFMEENLSCNKS